MLCIRYLICNCLNFNKTKKCELNDFMCPICLESDTENVITTRCFHMYHKKCIYSWIKRNRVCPICRSDI